MTLQRWYWQTIIHKLQRWSDDQKYRRDVPNSERARIDKQAEKDRMIHSSSNRMQSDIHSWKPLHPHRVLASWELDDQPPLRLPCLCSPLNRWLSRWPCWPAYRHIILLPIISSQPPCKLTYNWFGAFPRWISNAGRGVQCWCRLKLQTHP